MVIYKNDKNGNRLATVNRSEIPAEAKDTSYIDVDVTLGDNQLNDNVVNHYNALNQLTETLTKNYKVSFTYDAEGLRTGKTVNGEKTVYVWDEMCIRDRNMATKHGAEFILPTIRTAKKK